MKFRYYWFTGNVEILSGKDSADALNKAGYGAGALRALDYFEQVKDENRENDDILLLDGQTIIRTIRDVQEIDPCRIGYFIKNRVTRFCASDIAVSQWKEITVQEYRELQEMNR